METFHRIIPTPAGEALVHYVVYPNSSVFVWVTSANELDLDDLHIAVPDKFGRLPALTTRIGDQDSRGRFVALRLSKKLNIPVIVSWSLPESVDSDSLIESGIVNELQKRSVLVM